MDFFSSLEACPFCGTSTSPQDMHITVNTEINSYVKLLMSQVSPEKLFSRSCIVCSTCHSQYYSPKLSPSLLKSIYSGRFVHHNVGWSRYYNESRDTKRPPEATTLPLIIMDLCQSRIPAIYAEINCPFQGLALYLRQQPGPFASTTKMLLTIPSNEMWNYRCTDQSLKSGNLTCRKKALKDSIFDCSHSLYSQVFEKKMEQLHGKTSIVFLSNCLDHLPDPITILEYLSFYFTHVLIKVHPYVPTVGPSIQHSFAVGDNLQSWYPLLKNRVQIRDLSHLLMSHKRDRLISISQVYP